MKKMIQIAQPSLGEAEWKALKKPIMTGWITQGPNVKLFEDVFAQRHQVKHAIAVSNCTTALHLALLALGIGPDDEVIVPSFTWVASANAVIYCGAKPVLVDIDLNTFNIDPLEIKKHLNKKTKAIIAVHLFGLFADMTEIKKAAPGVPIIEDAACASGSGYKGRPAGSLGDLGCFSFHPRKVITTGEGGMVTTNLAKYAEKVDQLRNHGASISEEERHHGRKPYLLPEFSQVGYNYRMTDLQGAVGIVQLKKLDVLIKERQKWADYYFKELKDVDWLKTPVVPKNYQSNWQSYVCLIDTEKAPYSRNKIMDKLFQKGISTRPGTHAVHMLEYYRKTYGYKPTDLPNSKIAAEQSIAIPLHNQMAASDYEYIVKTLCQIK